jgi:hypothetical protein
VRKAGVVLVIVLALTAVAPAGCMRFIVTPPPDGPTPVDGARSEPVRDSTAFEPRQVVDGGRDLAVPIDRARDVCVDRRRGEPAADGPVSDRLRVDAPQPDAKPDTRAPDTGAPDAPGEVGTYSFNFSGALSGWTETLGSFKINGGQLVASSVGDNTIETPIVFDRAQGTVRFTGTLPVLDCRGANLFLLDGAVQALMFALDFCGPTYGGSGGHIVFHVGAAVHDVTWSAPDTSPHVVEVSFAGGSYTLRLDGAALATVAGPARIKATTLRLGGWVAAVPPGTPFDDVYLGP